MYKITKFAIFLRNKKILQCILTFLLGILTAEKPRKNVKNQNICQNNMLVSNGTVHASQRLV